MSQDIVSDALNQMMNALKAGKNSVVVARHSKLLISVLAIAKLKGYVSRYETNGNSLTIEFGKLNGCNSIKPRFIVKSDEYDSYAKRYLPAKNIGVIVVSTNKGLMTHQTAEESKIGGCLLAYFY
ncbi:MAG: 30S ribosomal protein S8 [Nanoarchaeota archaeon]